MAVRRRRARLWERAGCLACALFGLGLAPGAPPVDARLEEAERVMRRGEYARSRELASAVLAEALKRGDVGLEVGARTTLADIHFFQGDLAEYRTGCERALASARRAGDQHAIARSLYCLAYVYERTRPSRMLEILAEAADQAERAGDPAVRMRIHNAIGSAAHGLGRYALAQESFALARDLARQRKDENNEGVALSNLGLVAQARGDFEAAQRLFESALPLVVKHGNHRVQAGVLSNLANNRVPLGDPEGSLALQERAIAIWRRVDHKRGLSTALQGLAAVERQIGRPARAASLLDEALRIAAGLDDTRRSVFLLVALGELFVEQGRFEKAAPHLREALRLADGSGDPLLRALASLALAALETAAGRHPAALALIDGARDDTAAIGDRWTEGQAWAARAAALEALERRADAREAWARAIALHESGHARRFLHVWNGRLARLLARDGESEQAEARWLRSLAATEELEDLVALDRFRIALFREVADVYNAYAGWLAERGAASRAWQVLERGRARELRLRIAQAGVGARLATPERDALARLSDLQRRLAETAGRAEREALTRLIEEAEMAYERAQREAAAAAPPTERDTSARPAAPPRAGELRVQYAVDGDRLLVFSRSPQQVRVRVLADAPSLLRRARQFREAAAARSGAFTADREARALYDTLLGPELEGGGTTHVTLVPDAELHALPFPALQTPDGSWLVERVVLSQAPSEAALAELRPSGSGTGSVKVLGVASTQWRDAPGAAWRLPAAEAEARDVSRGEGSRALIDADEAAVKALPFGEYAVVHFASHAQVDDRHPERSALVLSRGGGEDGLLQAREIYRLSLPVRLVVVSSCRSGLGAALPGEGLVGLPHAFFAAGAHAVVATLWDVTDAGSAEMMRLFYDELAEHPLADALTLAQRRLLRSGRRSAPAHWAAYVAHGDAGQRLPVLRPVRLGPGLVAGGLLAVLLLGVIRIAKRRARGAGATGSA